MKDKPSYTGMDLAKYPFYKENQNWVGKKVSEIVNPKGVIRIILIEAVTSATADIDMANIIRIIRSADVFEFRPEPIYARDFWIWEALIESKNGEPFLFQANNDWVCIVSANGHGFAKFPLRD